MDGAVVQTGLPSQGQASFLAELADRFPGTVFAHDPHDATVLAAAQQLEEYASGRRRSFALPLRMVGTPFQQRVWQVLASIPFGSAWSYRDVAEAVGQPGASRAVGQANHRNPLAPIVPCHRVVTADGRLGGYGGGMDLKQRLLEHEGLRLA